MVSIGVMELGIEVSWEYDVVYRGLVSDFMIDYRSRVDLIEHLGLLEEHDELVLDLGDGIWRIVVLADWEEI